MLTLKYTFNMKRLIQVTVFIFAIHWCEIVKCSPHHLAKGFQKSFHLEFKHIPLPQISFFLEKLTPFGKYEFKHVIRKRQIAETEVSPELNEIPVNVVGTIEDAIKLPQGETLEKTNFVEENSVPVVIITTVIEPIEDDKSLLPADVKDVITPVDKEPLRPLEVVEHSESEIKVEEHASSEVVIEITPKPVDLPPPPQPEPIQNVVISPIEGALPPLDPIPECENSNKPVISPVIDSISNRPPLYTDITKIPLSGLPNLTPVVSVPEFIISSPPILPLPPPSPPLLSPLPPLLVPPPPLLPPPPLPIPSPLPLPPSLLPPPVKEEPPVVKEERPNFFVKGSRFVLYFGSMMLQMLSQLVNGRIDLNKPINIPLLSGVQ